MQLFAFCFHNVNCIDQFRQGAGEVSLWTLRQRSWYRVSWIIYYLLELTELILPRDDFYL